MSGWSLENQEEGLEFIPSREGEYMKKVPTILTKQEVKRIEFVVLQDIEESATPHQHFNSVRNYAVLRLLISAGLRVNELCGLRLDEVWPESII